MLNIHSSTPPFGTQQSLGNSLSKTNTKLSEEFKYYLNIIIIIIIIIIIYLFIYLYILKWDVNKI